MFLYLFILLGSLSVKTDLKMLVKLTPVVNFINILLAAFATIFLCQKNTKPNCKKRKAEQNTFAQKSCYFQHFMRAAFFDKTNSLKKYKHSCKGQFEQYKHKTFWHFSSSNIIFSKIAILKALSCEMKGKKLPYKSFGF